MTSQGLQLPLFNLIHLDPWTKFCSTYVPSFLCRRGKAEGTGIMRGVHLVTLSYVKEW